MGMCLKYTVLNPPLKRKSSYEYTVYTNYGATTRPKQGEERLKWTEESSGVRWLQTKGGAPGATRHKHYQI